MNRRTTRARAARQPGSDTAGGMILPLALAQFIASYAATNMNVAISAISKDLGTTVSGVQTAITLFTLTMAALMIPPIYIVITVVFPGHQVAGEVLRRSQRCERTGCSRLAIDRRDHNKRDELAGLGCCCSAPDSASC